MAAEEKRSSSIREMISDEQDQLRKELYRSDEEFDPSKDLPHGPAFFSQQARSRDEIVIDELLSSAPRNQGYYLKLHKESPLMPGHWEFKLKIDNYEGWVDLESEIANLVKAYTQKYGPKKWGTGAYKVSVWNEGGIRQQKKYPINTFMIDAGETDEVAQPSKHLDGIQDANEFVNQQFQTMKGFMDAMKGVLPAPADPNQQMTSLVNAWTQGRGEKRDSEGSSSQMMIALITAVMGMIPALVGNRNNDGQSKESTSDVMTKMMGFLKDGKEFMGGGGDQSLVGQLAQMKAIGIDPFHKEDTLDTIAKVKVIMQSASDLAGKGQVPVERPDIIEKLIDALAPHVPKMLSDFKSVTDNATKAQEMQINAREQAIREGRAPVPMDRRPTTRYGQPVGPQPDRMGASEAFHETSDMDPYSGFVHRPDAPPEERPGMWTPGDGSFRSTRPGDPTGGRNPNQAEPVNSPNQPVPPTQEKQTGMHPLLSQLYSLVNSNDRNAYPVLYQTLVGMPGAGDVIQAALEGSATVDQIIMMFQQWGGKAYRDPAFVRNLQSYMGGFVDWIKANVQAYQLKGECTKCGQIYWYDSLEKYGAEPDHKCGNQVSPTEECDGEVKLRGTSDEGPAKAEA